MGYETRCVATVRDADGMTREGEGAVLLETDELIVRGPARVRVPRSSIRDVRRDGDTLHVTHAAGSLSLPLGAGAAKWEARIAAPPKSVIDKLDVKPGARVWVSGAVSDELRAGLAERTSELRVGGRAPAACDVIFLAVDGDAELARVAIVTPALAERGALWVIHPKGAGGVLDTAIFAAAKAAGLVATKVARISETHTGEKLVRPKR